MKGDILSGYIVDKSLIIVTKNEGLLRWNPNDKDFLASEPKSYLARQCMADFKYSEEDRLIAASTRTHCFFLMDTATMTVMFEYQFDFEIDFYLTKEMVLIKQKN